MFKKIILTGLFLVSVGGLFANGQNVNVNENNIPEALVIAEELIIVPLKLSTARTERIKTVDDIILACAELSRQLQKRYVTCSHITLLGCWGKKDKANIVIQSLANVHDNLQQYREYVFSNTEELYRPEINLHFRREALCIAPHKKSLGVEFDFTINNRTMNYDTDNLFDKIED